MMSGTYVPERPKKMHATAAAEPTSRDNKINKGIKLKPSNFSKTPSDSSSQVDSALPPHKSRLETITSPLTDSLLSSCVHLINNTSKLLLLLLAVHNLRLQNSYEKLSKMMQGLGVANPAELKRKTRRFARFLGYSSLSLLSSNKPKKKHKRFCYERLSFLENNKVNYISCSTMNLRSYIG
jgi:hypothetical protein